jgi:hypothetical protein
MKGNKIGILEETDPENKNSKTAESIIRWMEDFERTQYPNRPLTNQYFIMKKRYDKITGQKNATL